MTSHSYFGAVAIVLLPATGTENGVTEWERMGLMILIVCGLRRKVLESIPFSR
jgi:hypothetical protein